MKTRLSFRGKSQSYHEGYFFFLVGMDYYVMSAAAPLDQMGDRMAGWKDAEWDTTQHETMARRRKRK